MGAGVSQQQVEDHLARQERLVAKLEAQLAAQRATAGGGVAINFASEPTAVLASAKATDAVLTNLEAAARKGETRKKPEGGDVPADELALPPSTWTEPTPEEEKALLASKPWLASMAMPTGFAYGATDAKPDVSLQLEHVYGYRSERLNTVFAVGPTQLLYSAATVGIVHDTKTQEQVFFQGHSDDIVCMAHHAARGVAASGEQGKIPSICVWDTRTGKQVAKVAGSHRRAISALAFSPDGSLLVAAGLDDERSVVVYDWAKGAPLARASASGRVLALAFKDSRRFVTVGSDHLAFWTFDPAASGDAPLTSEPGLLGDLGKRQVFVSVAFTDAADGGQAIVGTQSGELYLFAPGGGNRIARVVDAHQGCINVVRCAFGHIFAAGSDGYVSVWNATTLRKATSVSLPDDGSPVRALDVIDQSTIVMGTLAGRIAAVNWTNAAVTTHVTAHHGDLRTAKATGEINGLAASPDGTRFVSAGEDGVLSVWNGEKKCAELQRKFSGRAQCLAWSPDGKSIVLGLQDGRVAIYDEKLVELRSMKNRKRRITAVKFSPSGALLAVASADNCVDIYDAKSDFERKATCGGLSCVVVSIDFSSDEKYLQSTTQGYELVFYDLATFKQVEAPRSLRDTPFATWSSILGWNVQGIWPLDQEFSEIDAVAVSGDGKHVAIGEATGGVRLFRYPCVGGGLDREGRLTRRPQSVVACGHSEHVTQVVWLTGRLVTAGGADLALFQWKVVPKAA